MSRCEMASMERWHNFFVSEAALRAIFPLVVAGMWVLIYGANGIYWTVPAVRS
jgi:hypothetical protein